MSGTLRGAAGVIGAGAALAAATDAVALYADRNRLAGLFSERYPLQFPSDLNRNASVPYMSMQFSAYRRRSINEQPFYESQMKIRLPIPEGLVEQTSLNYQNDNLGSVAGALTDVASAGVPTSLQGAATAIGTAAAGAGIGIAQNFVQAAGAAGQTAVNAISALSGITTNPFQVVLFKSPNFRSHSFSWKFVPRNPAESETLRSIIEVFKYHSLPGVSAFSGVFFSYPEILEINFRPSDTFLYKFKPCVVESVVVNFAPSGPSFFRSTNAPTAVQFTIKVQEIEIWTKADYFRNIAQGQ
jgi:hypothetical protein